MRILHTRPAPPRPLDALTGPGAPLVFYATGVDRNSRVSGWTADSAWAEEFDAATVARVLANQTDGRMSSEPPVNTVALLATDLAPEPGTKPQKPARKGRSASVK